MTSLEGIRTACSSTVLFVLVIAGIGCQRDAEAEPTVPPPLEATAAVITPPKIPVEAPVVSAEVVDLPEVAEPAPEQVFLSVSIERSLESSLVAATEPMLGAQLAQVTKRVMVWWLDVRRHLRKGDKLEIVYETREDQEPIVHAIWFTSAKLARTMSAVRFQPEGERFARWYDADGREIEKRLKNGPMSSYEQVTSLLRDGRGHRGVDFKAPIGEAIIAPFSGRVVRRNWSFRRNGNCLEIVDDKTGIHAFFLHLASVGKKMRAGARVKRGQVIATSGNTGRSTAPHLHYQLERSGRVVDPFRFHKTWQKQLSKPDSQAAARALARFHELRTRST